MPIIYNPQLSFNNQQQSDIIISLLTNMRSNVNLNPIQKHKLQIEKRITLLEQKFKEKEIPRENVKKLRDLIQDENKVTQNQGIITSKTVEVRGKIRSQVEASKVKNESTDQPIHLVPLAATNLARNVKEDKQPQQCKDEKINQLYDMMRSILEGQRNIEKELSELKKDQLRESGRKKINQQASLYNGQKQKVNQSIIDNVSRSKEKVGQRSNKKNSKNQSFLYQQNDDNIKVQEHQNKKIKTKKNCNFEDLLGELKGKQKNGSRICVGEEWKARIWLQVQERVKESEKEYKDTIHRNNKHEFQHLMSTFELQRKLKDDLIDKVYLQCNGQIYK